MDTRFLESFVMVVEHGSVAEAARRLGLTAAAVTQRLRALEEEIGQPLVARAGRVIRPTEAGDAILPRAHALLAELRGLRAAASHRDFAGELSLGAVASALTGLLPDILARLARRHPLLTLQIEPGISAELYRRVEGGGLDAAVIVEPAFSLPKTCGWRCWREEPLVVLAPRTLEARDPLAILREQPFIRYDRRQWGGRLAETYLQRSRIRPRDRYELDSLDAIAVLVDRGLGVSLVPDWAPPWPQGLCLRKLALPGEVPRRRIGLLWRRASRHLRLVEALLAEASG